MDQTSNVYLQEGRASISDRLIVGILAVVALAAHLLAVRHAGTIHLYGDAVHYDFGGQLILQKHIFGYWSATPTAQVTPGFPLFLAFCYFVAHFFSASHNVQMHFAMVVQSLLMSATILIVYGISRLVMRPLYSVIAALIWLTYPPSFSATKLLLTETLYIFFLLLFLYVVLVAITRKSLVLFFISGLLLGLCVLVRPTIFPFILAPVLLFFLREYRELWQRTVMSFVLYAVGCIIVMIPWWIRNYVDFHKVILTSKDLGNPLLYGTTRDFNNNPSLAKGLSADQQTALAITRIREQFHAHPLATLKWYTLDKLNLLFGTPWYTPSKGSLGVVLNGLAHLHLVWVILGAIGVVLGLFHRRMVWISIVAIVLIILQLPFIPINRYVFPVMPLLIIGTAFLLARIFRGTIHGTKDVSL